MANDLVLSPNNLSRSDAIDLYQQCSNKLAESEAREETLLPVEIGGAMAVGAAVAHEDARTGADGKLMVGAAAASSTVALGAWAIGAPPIVQKALRTAAIGTSVATAAVMGHQRGLRQRALDEAKRSEAQAAQTP